MNERVLVVAPHPDDETLGCGGTLLRMAQAGAHIAWLIVTDMKGAAGYSDDAIRRREAEISTVSEYFGFSEVFRLGFPTSQLDTLPMVDLIGTVSSVFKAFQPELVFLPSRADVHTDHRAVFDAGAACAKWFRYGSLRRVLAYETLSETGNRVVGSITLPRRQFRAAIPRVCSQFLYSVGTNIDQMWRHKFCMATDSRTLSASAKCTPQRSGDSRASDSQRREFRFSSRRGVPTVTRAILKCASEWGCGIEARS